MGAETAALPDLSDFEFCKIIHENLWGKLRLPDKFAELLDGQEPREVKLREASGGRRLWDVAVWFDGEGHMYLERGWEQFARDHDLGLGNFLVFSYDGDAVLTVKVFDGSMCRRHYKHDDDARTTTQVPRSSQHVTIKEEDGCDSAASESSIDTGRKNSADSGSKKSTANTDSGSGSDSGTNNSTYSVSNNIPAEMEIDDALTSQFTVTLKKSHLGVRQEQYLNVPPAFQNAHGYDKRSEVVLWMRGKPWTVLLKHNVRTGGRNKTRTTIRYGWHQFCVDNGLDVGDVCFFRVLRLRGGDAGRGEDHALKVEARKPNGTFLE